MIHGLLKEQVVQSRSVNGSNQLTYKPSKRFVIQLLENFNDPMIIILSIALSVMICLWVIGYTHIIDPIGIACAIIIAVTISTISEYKSGKKYTELRMTAEQVLVKTYRGDNPTNVPINDIVVGDIIILQQGDQIPADCNIIIGQCHVNESTFTGEPTPIFKNNSELLKRGTLIVDGEVICKVEVIGDDTEYGTLNFACQPDESTGPLRIKLEKVAQLIAKIAYSSAIGIVFILMGKSVITHTFINGVFNFDNYIGYPLIIDLVNTIIAACILIVVIVPEGLPMMISMVLSWNMSKLLCEKVLVRRLSGIESAGSVNIVFTDKTGTLTYGQLMVNECYILNNDGVLYVPFNISDNLLHNLILNNDCKCGQEIIGGNSTDRALVKYLIDSNQFLQMTSKKIGHQPFCSSTKMSSTTIDDGGVITEYLKGAPEVILKNCTHWDDNGTLRSLNVPHINTILSTITTISTNGNRIIAFAQSNNEKIIFTGIVSLNDKLRPTTQSAITTLKNAGIKVIMLTGDSLSVAKTIAKQCGIGSYIIDATQIENISSNQLSILINNGIDGIARSTPAIKERLITVAQDMGKVVMMTGDGANDAPAINKADVGVAMGSGSDITKSVSDMVILNNSISSIVTAIHYGRSIYRAIQKFIVFQMTVGFSTLFIMVISPFIGIDMPLTMTQLLWVNLIMDTLAAIAFSGEYADPEYMRESPKRKHEPIITRQMWTDIGTMSVIIGAMCITFLSSDWIVLMFRTLDIHMTAFFGFFVFCNNWNKFNARASTQGIIHNLWKNKAFMIVIMLIFTIQIIMMQFGGGLMRTVPLTLSEYIIIILMSMPILTYSFITRR